MVCFCFFFFRLWVTHVLKMEHGWTRRIYDRFSQVWKPVRQVSTPVSLCVFAHNVSRGGWGGWSDFYLSVLLLCFFILVVFHFSIMSKMQFAPKCDACWRFLPLYCYCPKFNLFMVPTRGLIAFLTVNSASVIKWIPTTTSHAYRAMKAWGWSSSSYPLISWYSGLYKFCKLAVVSGWQVAGTAWVKCQGRKRADTIVTWCHCARRCARRSPDVPYPFSLKSDYSQTPFLSFSPRILRNHPTPTPTSTPYPPPFLWHHRAIVKTGAWSTRDIVGGQTFSIPSAERNSLWRKRVKKKKDMQNLVLNETDTELF